MARITFIGAGSLGFTRGLVRDILTFPLLKDATLVLMDINKERLEFARKACQIIVDRGRYPAKVVATMDRTEALTGDPTLVYRSVCYDPLSAAVLSLAEIRKMTAEMLRKNRPYLPEFKSLAI